MRMKYLFLAVLYPNKRAKKLKIELKRSEGEVWSNFNRWLEFQTQYINPKKWAVTPLIRGVTLVNTEKTNIHSSTLIPVESKALIEAATKKYEKTFTGISKSTFQNWVTRNYLLANSFRDQQFMPFSDDKALIEIGPGLGAVLTLANLSKPRIVYSYDTFQMQEVFSAVQDKSPSDFKKLLKIAINAGQSFDEFKVIEKEYNLIAFWSFTELKENERHRYVDLINNAKNVLIATNEQFEGINNFDYLEELARNLNKNIQFKYLSEVYGSNVPGYQLKHRIYLIKSK